MSSDEPTPEAPEQLSESEKEIRVEPHAETNDGTDSNVKSEASTSSTHPNENVRDNKATVVEVTASIGVLGPSSGSTADLPVSGTKDESIEHLLQTQDEGLEEKTDEEFREEPPSLAITSPNSTSRSMTVKLPRFENRKPDWCLSPITLGVGRGSNQRLLYLSRELLILHSPVFERMFAEGNGFRESEPDAVIELPDDDPKEFNELLQDMRHNFDFGCRNTLRLASKYLMEDVIRFFDYLTPVKTNDVSGLSFLTRLIDDVSLPRTKAAVFREVCTRQCLDELKKHDAWEKISATLHLELTEHYHDDQRKANGREGFCSIVVPEIQWPDLLTFESPAHEHCGGVASLRLIVGRGEEKRVLHCSKELIFDNFSALRERLHNDGDSLELEDDSADDFVHYMNWKLRKRPWEAFSVHQQSAILCLASKYRAQLNVRDKIHWSESFTLCHKLYLAEQCHYRNLQKKCLKEISRSAEKLSEARRSEWWPQLSTELRSSLHYRLV